MPRLWLIYAKLLIISMKINVKQSFSFETQYSLKNVNINPPPPSYNPSSSLYGIKHQCSGLSNNGVVILGTASYELPRAT